MLNRCTALKLYPGFESLPHRQTSLVGSRRASARQASPKRLRVGRAVARSAKADPASSISDDAPRVRFAPSPTGYLHVGGARTALFNWLFARRHGGVFVLRIEDTDVERSSDEMVEGILDGLRWLGLDWDEGPKIGGPYGPYFQSERLDRHRAMAERLVAEGHAYYCYCTPEELKAKRDAAEQARRRLAVRPHLLRADAATRSPRASATSVPRAVRFRVPDGTTRFDDLVHGPIEFDGANIEDFVILRSDGQPTYQLSVVSDDVEMAITHVVRGDDHISNTPKQILLYHAVGAPVPQFAHVPLILGPDKKRLSKRHGATSVMEYARQGYLPEAMVNFLALLGWSPGRRSGAVHARRAGRARSRSKASAAATRSSTPKSSTGSTSSTSCGCAPDELARAAEAVARSGRAVGRRAISAIGTRGSSPCSSC